MKLRRHELHGLTGAYALDALTDPERDSFERHLHRCHTCANEVRGFRETATRLAVAVSATPPPGLRERVLASAATTRQLPPEVARTPPARHRPGRTARTDTAGRPGGTAWFTRVTTALAAAGVAAAVALGLTQSSTQHQLDQARTQNQAVAAVLAAPDARLTAGRTSAGGVATVVTSQSRHEMVASTSGLPALAGGKIYELWFIAPGNVRPAGLLPAPEAGQTAPLIASGLAAGDQVALTVEPAGGTRQPTTKPILVMTLPA